MTFFSCFFLALLLCFAAGSPAFASHTATAGGETITWDFQGIPPQGLMIPVTPCTSVPTNGYYSCSYGLIDPPYGEEITFSASMLVNSGSFPDLTFGYYDLYNVFHIIETTQCVSLPCNLSFHVSFYIPQHAVKFALIFHSVGGGTSGNNIQLDYQIANYDPVRANLFGGDDVNPDTQYCDDQAQPGEPKIRKFRNKKGAGPGT